MPTVSIYVSNEDYDKFRAIEKKSEFIHNALNPDPSYKPPTERPHALEKIGHTELRKPIKTPDVPFETFFKKSRKL